MRPMEIIAQLLDFILHVDKRLEVFVQNYGLWVYALLFLIIFVETGVVVMPFLPGDSLLFVVGAMCGAGLMDYTLAVVLLLLRYSCSRRLKGPTCQAQRPQMPYCRTILLLLYIQFIHLLNIRKKIAITTTKIIIICYIYNYYKQTKNI